MNKINKVFFRTNQHVTGRDGYDQRNWFGEDSYMLNETVSYKIITVIEFGFMHDDTPCVRVLVEGSKLYCEIPMTSVCRIYYSLED